MLDICESYSIESEVHLKKVVRVVPRALTFYEFVYTLYIACCIDF